MTQQTPELSKKEDEEIQIINNFFILTFSPNPDKDEVKVTIPSADYSALIKREKFIKLMINLIS